MDESRMNVVNRDNDLLHPWGPIGHVDEVNGPGAMEVPQFVPTRHELFQLAKYWALTVLDMDFCYFCYQQTGSTEIRLGPFANRRINRIAEYLGASRVQEAWKAAEDEFAKTVDARDWHVFRHGTPDELAAFRKEMDAIEAKLSEDYDARFYEDVMRYVSGEPHDLTPGTNGMQWAERAKELIAANPDLALPDRKAELLKAAKGEWPSCERMITNEDDLPDV